MILRNLSIVVVCLVFVAITASANAQPWTFRPAAFVQGQQDSQVLASAHAKKSLPSPAGTQPQRISKVKPYKRITKCRPQVGYGSAYRTYGPMPHCLLPVPRAKGWELGAQVFFARVKGKVRFVRGGYTSFGLLTGYGEDVDLNDDLKVPEHAAVPEFTATYRFRPRWAMRYSIMPMVMQQSGTPNREFVFGAHNYNTNQTVRVKWERTLQRMGLVYDPIKTYRSRISVFADYVRLDDKLAVIDPTCCGERMDTELNMAMTGLEFEKCLKTGRMRNTLSLVCKAGIAFGDDAVGSDIQTGVKYSIPLGCGRWGYVKGGYRFLTYKKKSSDARLIDTAMEGGTVQVGLVF